MECSSRRKKKGNRKPESKADPRPTYSISSSNLSFYPNYLCQIFAFLCKVRQTKNITCIYSPHFPDIRSAVNYFICLEVEHVFCQIIDIFVLVAKTKSICKCVICLLFTVCANCP